MIKSVKDSVVCDSDGFQIVPEEWSGGSGYHNLCQEPFRLLAWARDAAAWLKTLGEVNLILVYMGMSGTSAATAVAQVMDIEPSMLYVRKVREPVKFKGRQAWTDRRRKSRPDVIIYIDDHITTGASIQRMRLQASKLASLCPIEKVLLQAPGEGLFNGWGFELAADLPEGIDWQEDIFLWHTDS